MALNNYSPSFVKQAFQTFFRAVVSLIFCAVLFATLLDLIDHALYRTALGIVMFAIFVAIIYSGQWYIGQSERNLVEHNQLKKRLFRSSAVCGAAAVPLLAANIAMVLSYRRDASNVIVFFKLLNSPAFPVLNLLDITQTGQGIFAVILLPLVLVMTGTVGYILGYYGKSLLFMAMYKEE